MVHTLLQRADAAGKRIDFIRGVGVHGKVQDITALVAWMTKHLPELDSDQPGQLSTNHLNRYRNAGTGYFANGAFFTVEFDDELAFFIDNQRIYLNRQIKRSVLEAEQALANQL
ncbi:hypothetical protein [Spirosoma terrae]